MVQRDDSMDYNLHFALSFSERETERIRVFNIKIQEKSTRNRRFNKRRRIIGLQISVILSIHEDPLFKHNYLLISIFFY